MSGAKAALLEALEAAGRIMLRRFRRTGYVLKGRANLVTAADLESQRTIRSLLARRFPRHGFIAEEKGKRHRAEYTWIVDPLDGTTNYAHGYPVACVSIGLLRGEEAVLGGVHDPFRGETFAAERGRGARLNGRPMRVTKVAALEESLLVTGFPYDRAERADYYVRFYSRFMKRAHDIRRSGSAALDQAWVAAGRLDGFWEFKLAPWDVAAGKLLVEEAGGKVTDFKGRPWSRLEDYGRQTLATNGLLHPAMLRILRAGV